MPEFKEFRIGDLFDITGTKSMDVGRLSFISEGINFIGRTSVNNGIQGKIVEQLFPPNEANTLTSAVVGEKTVKYQEEPYYCSQNINKLIPKFQINRYIGLYFSTVLEKFLSRYAGYSGYKLNDIKDGYISLPSTTQYVPDFSSLETLVALEREREREREVD